MWPKFNDFFIGRSVNRATKRIKLFSFDNAILKFLAKFKFDFSFFFFFFLFHNGYNFFFHVFAFSVFKFYL